jgi:dTMP kinase
MKNGLFITVEGLDGSGKTTQVQGIKEYFEKMGIEPLMVREPGGTRIGEKVRCILLDNDNSEMDSVAEMLLYAASRAQNVAENILPALAEGRVVICDRFIDSSVAYQGYGRELDVEEVYNVNLAAVRHRLPDATFFLDKKPKASLQRRIEASGADRLESEKMEFHDRVYNGYMELCNKYPERIIRLDAEDSIEAINKKIVTTLDSILERK